MIFNNQPWKKIILALAGILLFVILLEVGLRSGEFIFLSLQKRRNMISLRQKDAYRIMCIGESTTALGGEDSYPSQLEGILNYSGGGIRFSVINSGIPGISSSGIIERLEEDLERYSPDMVVVMMGINDNDINWSQAAKPYGGQSYSVNSLRTYKLIRLILRRVALKLKEETVRKNGTDEYIPAALEAEPKNPANIESGREGTAELKDAIKYYYTASHYHNAGKYGEAEEYYKKAITADPFNYDAYFSLAWVYECQSRHEDASAYFKKAIELKPENGRAYRGLGQVYFYQHSYAQAAQMLEKSILIDPGVEVAYMQLGQCYLVQEKYTEAEEIIKKAVSLNLLKDRAFGELAMIYKIRGDDYLARVFCGKANNFRLQYYNIMTNTSYHKLKEILDRKKIKLICMQYPHRSIESLRKIFGNGGDIIFVSNEKIFKDVINKDNYREYFIDMFGGDFGHCTRKGNGLIARNIASVILKEVFNRPAEAAEMRQELKWN